MDYRILLIEDNYTLRRLYGRTLQRDGMTVTAVETIEDAEAVLNSGEKFDAAVCDIQLTDGDAMPLIRNIHARGIPILAMSSDESYRPIAITAGANAFLQKPIPTRILSPEVDRVILFGKNAICD